MLAFTLLSAVRAAPLWSQTIIGDDGAALGTLAISSGEEPADQIHRWCSEVALDTSACGRLITQVCGAAVPAVTCTRMRPRVFTSAVGDVGTIEIWADEEPADAAHAFCTAHSLNARDRYAILVAACNAEGVTCRREAPIIFRVAISARGEGNGVIGDFTLLEHEEPADAFYAFCLAHPHTMDGAYCAALMEPVLEQACAVAPCARRRAQTYSNDIVVDGKTVGHLELWHDEEPVDKIYTLCADAVVDDATCAAVAAQLCGHAVFCARTRPLLVSQSVNAPGRGHIGVVEVLKGDEAADRVHAFFVQHALPADWDEAQIVEVICQKLQRLAGAFDAASNTFVGCTRRRAIAIEIAVQECPEQRLSVWGDEEGADAVWRFIAAPAHTRRLVATNAALLAAADALGAEEGTALLLQSKSLRAVYHTLLAAVCKEALVRCTRATPIVFVMEVARGPTALPPHAAVTWGDGASQGAQLAAEAAANDAEALLVFTAPTPPSCVTVRGGWRWIAGNIFTPVAVVATGEGGGWRTWTEKLPTALLAMCEAMRAPLQKRALDSKLVVMLTAHPLAEIFLWAAATVPLFVLLRSCARRAQSAVRGGQRRLPSQTSSPTPRSPHRSEAGTLREEERVRFVKSPTVAALRIDCAAQPPPPPPRQRSPSPTPPTTPAGEASDCEDGTPVRRTARRTLDLPPGLDLPLRGSTRLAISRGTPSHTETHRGAAPGALSDAYVAGWDFGTIAATPVRSWEAEAEAEAEATEERREIVAKDTRGDGTTFQLPLVRWMTTLSSASAPPTPHTAASDAEEEEEEEEEEGEEDEERSEQDEEQRKTVGTNGESAAGAARRGLPLVLTIAAALLAMVGGAAIAGVLSVLLIEPIDAIDRSMHRTTLLSKPLEIHAWEEVSDALLAWATHKDVAKHHVLLDYDGVRTYSHVTAPHLALGEGYRARSGSASGVAERFFRRHERRKNRADRRAAKTKLEVAEAKAAAEEEFSVAALRAKWAGEDEKVLANAAATATPIEPKSSALEDELDATLVAVRAGVERNLRADWAAKREARHAASRSAAAAAKTKHIQEAKRASEEAVKRRWRDIAPSRLYSGILETLCSPAFKRAHPSVLCTRHTASELIETVTVTQYGVGHDALLRHRIASQAGKEGMNIAHADLRYDPAPPGCVDPTARLSTHGHLVGATAKVWAAAAAAAEAVAQDVMQLCAAQAAMELCSRMRPSPADCHQSLFDAVRASYAAAETRRWSGKKTDHYVTLSIAKNALYREIDEAYRFERWNVGADVTPWAARGNASGTPLWPSWDARTNKLHLIEAARTTLLSPTSRKFEDQPCEPVFGGAMCARRTADGGMSIVMG